MRKSIVAMLVAIAGLLAWNSANAGEVLWSYTDNTDYHVPPLAQGIAKRTGWFPLANAVYSDERGSKGQDYVFDSLYVTINAELSLDTGPLYAATACDSFQLGVWLQTSEDKSTVSRDSVLVFQLGTHLITGASGAYLFGGSISRSAFGFSQAPTQVPLARYGRLVFAHYNAAKGGADSTLVNSFTVRAVGTSR